MSQKEGARRAAPRGRASTRAPGRGPGASIRSADPREQSGRRAPAPGVGSRLRDVVPAARSGPGGVGVDAERRVVGLQLAEVGLDLDDPAARR